MALQASSPSVSGTGQRRGDRPRVQPYSEEAERGLVGASLLEPSRVLDLCTASGIGPGSFYISSHSEVFDAMLEMSQRNQVIDLLTVSQHLRDIGKLDAIGGATFLEQLVESTPTAAHAQYYMDIVFQKYLLRTVIDRARETIDDCYASEEDASEILGKAESTFFEIAAETGSSVRSWSDLVKGAMSDFETIFQTGRGVTGLSTGFRDIDRLLMGFKAGDMIILAARPSMGKTSLAMNIVENITTGYKGCSVRPDDPSPKPVGIFSLEMSAEQLVRRMVCCAGKVPSDQLSSGYLSKDFHTNLMSAADTLIKAPIYLDDTPGLSVLELRSRARRMVRKYDVGFFVIDYLQLLHYPQKAENKQLETAAMSAAVKGMAKELQVPVLVLSQLSRAPESRDRLAVPKLSDLRDSGSIEQDADIVMLLRRPCKYPDDEEANDKTLSVVHVAKHRNGPTGEIRMNFHEQYTRFSDRTQREAEAIAEPAVAPGGGGFD